MPIKKYSLLNIQTKEEWANSSTPRTGPQFMAEVPCGLVLML